MGFEEALCYKSEQIQESDRTRYQVEMNMMAFPASSTGFSVLYF